MTELEVSGESRYDYGPIYAKYLLDELAVIDDPEKLSNVASQVEILQASGTISDEIAQTLKGFIEMTSSGALP